MLKIRMQGTVKDIQWFQWLVENHKGIRVLEISKPFANKGTNRYFRVYAEIEEESEKAKKQREQREGMVNAENTV